MMILISVDLPAPLLPTSARTSPSAISNVASDKARTPGNDLDSPRQLRATLPEAASPPNAAAPSCISYDPQSRKTALVNRFVEPVVQSGRLLAGEEQGGDVDEGSHLVVGDYVDELLHRVKSHHLRLLAHCRDQNLRVLEHVVGFLYGDVTPEHHRLALVLLCDDPKDSTFGC